MRRRSLARPLPRNQVLERDEILPSEEITQGTQPLKDNLMPQETEEAIKNPFEEEPAFEEINVAPPAAATLRRPSNTRKNRRRLRRPTGGRQGRLR